MEEVSETSNRAIALLIGVSDLHVSRLKRDLLKKASWEVEHIDVKIMATAFKKKKEELQRRAMEGQDYSLAWKIECDYIAKMQDLGFIYKEPEKHLVGSIELDMERGLMEYFEENGVPSVSQFIERMSQIGDGNGNGSKPGENTKLLAKSVN
jgi:hypothetical protein